MKIDNSINSEDFKKLMFFMIAIMSLLFLSNIGLIYQNLNLRSQLTGKLPKTLLPNDTAVAFSALSLDGTNTAISYKQKGTKKIFFYFSSSCPYCNEQFPTWNQLRTAVDNTKYEVFGLTSERENVEKLKNYLKKEDATSLLTLKLPQNIEKEYKLSLTPTTVIISENGIVEKIWVGKWDDKTKKEAYSYLNLPS